MTSPASACRGAGSSTHSCRHDPKRQDGAALQPALARGPHALPSPARGRARPARLHQPRPPGEARTHSIPSRQRARQAAQPGHKAAAPAIRPRPDRQGPSLAPLACLPRRSETDGQRHQAPRGRFSQALRRGRLTEEHVCRTQRSDEGRIHALDGPAAASHLDLLAAGRGRRRRTAPPGSAARRGCRHGTPQAGQARGARRVRADRLRVVRPGHLLEENAR